MLQPTPSEWIYSFYCPSLSVASIRVVRTNYNCSIPVTQQFSDKLKINPGRNKSATFRRQSLYLDNCFWFKFSIKSFQFDDLINVIFRSWTWLSWQLARRVKEARMESNTKSGKCMDIINPTPRSKKSIFSGLSRTWSWPNCIDALFSVIQEASH